LKELEKEKSEREAELLGYTDTTKTYWELKGVVKGLDITKQIIKKAFEGVIELAEQAHSFGHQSKTPSPH